MGCLVSVAGVEVWSWTVFSGDGDLIVNGVLCLDWGWIQGLLHGLGSVHVHVLVWFAFRELFGTDNDMDVSDMYYVIQTQQTYN